jgi:multidrug transporter EmrE-like cation transporter
MNATSIAVFGAVAGAITLGVADMLMKSGRWILGTALYLISAAPAYWAFQSPSYRWIFNVWAAAAVIFTVGISVAYYGEPMTAKRYIASGLILAAMLLEG